MTIRVGARLLLDIKCRGRFSVLQHECRHDLSTPAAIMDLSMLYTIKGWRGVSRASYVPHRGEHHLRSRVRRSGLIDDTIPCPSSQGIQIFHAPDDRLYYPVWILTIQRSPSRISFFWKCQSAHMSSISTLTLNPHRQPKLTMLAPFPAISPEEFAVLSHSSLICTYCTSR